MILLRSMALLRLHLQHDLLRAVAYAALRIHTQGLYQHPPAVLCLPNCHVDLPGTHSSQLLAITAQT